MKDGQFDWVFETGELKFITQKHGMAWNAKELECLYAGLFSWLTGWLAGCLVALLNNFTINEINIYTVLRSNLLLLLLLLLQFTDNLP